MTAFPATIDEARAHVEDIRLRRLGQLGSEASVLESALDILSEQLYTKSWHFLLELIQNADDNTYTSPSPTFNIDYRDPTLRFDCNEVGFTKANVEALCSMGASSKTHLPDGPRYTGEKGIGFKSVFKIADVVWIRSGKYSFKFDRTERLGMIAPIWCEFPFDAKPGFSSIVLHLSDSNSCANLHKEIKALGVSHCVFLRQIKNTISRWREDFDTQDRLDLVRLQGNGTIYSYLMLQQSIKLDSERAGSRQADVSVAFPTNRDEPGDADRPQHVYSCLPIRDYGFKFLLHSNFVLTANREDIDESSLWNQEIGNALPQALFRAVKLLSRGSFRYEWPQYFPSRPRTEDFFREIEPSLTRLVSKEEILESLSGRFATPGSLIYVPPQFRDGKGQPLSSYRGNNERYLSRHYRTANRPLLQKLGVRDMSPEEFLHDLSSFMTRSPLEYQQRSWEWHSSLARALISVMSSSPESRSAIFDLPLVPLRNGQWITGQAAQGGGAVLPMESKDLVIPPGIGFSEVDPGACRDDQRRSLFLMMGIERLSADKVSSKICDSHADERFRPEGALVPDLVAQVVFLFRASWTNPRAVKLWFVTEAEGRQQGSRVYIHSDKPYSATKYFGATQGLVDFLHSSYFDSIAQGRAAFSDWLIDQCNLNGAPRLTEPTPWATKPFTLSSDFEYIMDNFPPLEMMMLLRTHWLRYRQWVSREHSARIFNIHAELSRKELIYRLSSHKVPCRGGKLRQLSRTALPIPLYLEDRTLDADLLDVPDPENEEWHFLGHFGVLVGSGGSLDFTGTRAEAHIIRLRELRQKKEPSVDEISRVYQAIYLMADTERRLIRSAFTMQALIYVPNSPYFSEQGWFRSGKCRWSGPRALQKTPRLSQTYPALSQFFCATLQLQDADLPSVTEEVLQICPSDGLRYIAGLLACFSQQLSMNNTFLDARPDLRRLLLSSRIFPIALQPMGPHVDFDRLETAQETDMWFIADRTHLRKCFEGIVPLLAIDTSEMPEFGHLIDELYLGHRRLSARASKSSETHGAVDTDQEYTNLMRQKATFISRLIPQDVRDRASLIDFLRTITVYGAERITVEQEIKLRDGETVPGRSDAGELKISLSDQGLALYLHGKETTSRSVPIELVEFLAEFCSIAAPENIMVLQYILFESNLEAIADALDRRGIFEQPGDSRLFGDKELRLSGMFSHKNNEPSLSMADREALRAFLDDVEKARSVKQTISRRWESNTASELKPFLSKVCQLEKQDVSIFLPQSDMDKALGGSDHTNDMHEVAYFTSGLLADSERESRTSLFLPAVVAVSKTRKPKFRILSPAINTQDPEILFLGELHMSQMLENFMGQAYDPSKEWTSMLRTNAGFKPCETIGDSISSAFTIQDRGGCFTRTLTRFGYRGSLKWAARRTFHLDLITVEGQLADAAFYLHPRQIEIARKCYIDSTKSERPDSIAVLAIVFNIRNNPEIALLVDPWKMFLQGYLDLMVESHSLASFLEMPPLVLLPNAGKQPAGQLASNSMHSSYIYKPLVGFKAFRLLRLDPGPADAPLRGIITVHSATSRPAYKALSYPWGTALKSYRLSTPEGSLLITASCDSALRSIRKPDEPVLIWVDAVCIDQNNSHEKVIQIRHMRDIFESAEMVYAWIGDASTGSDLAIRTLLQIHAQESNTGPWPPDLPPIPLAWVGRRVPISMDPAWEALDAIFDRDWFKRVWITQEIVVASNVTVICGSQRASWDRIFEALEICLEEAQDMVETGGVQPGTILQSTAPALAIGHTRRLYSNPLATRKHDLVSLFRLFSHTKASLERDKMFGLLGLAADAESNNFDPDYDSPFEAVVRRFAAAFIARGQVFELLYRGGASKSYDFSSWIPAWTRTPYPRSISTWYSRAGSFSASGSTSAYTSLLPGSPDIIKISGTVIDSVSSVGTTTLAEADMWTFVNSLHSSIESLGPSYPNGEPLEDVKLLLPIGSAGRPYLERPNDAGLTAEAEAPSQDGSADQKPEWSKAISNFTSIQKFIDFFRQPEDVRAGLWRYWQTVSAFSSRLGGHARFAATGRGYAGLTASAAQPGDLVVLLHGGCVPFVVRRAAAGEDEDRYILVGECYVHGLMHGEGLQFDGVKEEMFALI